MFALPKWLTDIRKLFATADGKVLGRVGGAWQFLSSFVPSAHKDSHATGGGDELTPADIGATNTSHDHTNGNGAQIDYGSLGNVPSTFTPASHYQDASTVNVYTGNFSGNLSAADDSVQKALETIDAMSVGGGSSGQINLTSATEDYLLAVGETAFIDYANATSVPLRVSTDPIYGEYELTVTGDTSVAIGTQGSVLLLPNNTTYSSGAFKHNAAYVNMLFTSTPTVGTAGMYKDGTTFTAPLLCYSLLIKVFAKITTVTKSKSLILMQAGIRTGDSIYNETDFVYWNDTTTAWTSLGTITFPFAQSGRAIIKRIF